MAMVLLVPTKYLQMLRDSGAIQSAEDNADTDHSSPIAVITSMPVIMLTKGLCHKLFIPHLIIDTPKMTAYIYDENGDPLIIEDEWTEPLWSMHQNEIIQKCREHLLTDTMDANVAMAVLNGAIEGNYGDLADGNFR